MGSRVKGVRRRLIELGADVDAQPTAFHMEHPLSTRHPEVTMQAQVSAVPLSAFALPSTDGQAISPTGSG